MKAKIFTLSACLNMACLLVFVGVYLLHGCIEFMSAAPCFAVADDSVIRLVAELHPFLFFIGVSFVVMTYLVAVITTVDTFSITFHDRSIQNVERQFWSVLALCLVSSLGFLAASAALLVPTSAPATVAILVGCGILSAIAAFWANMIVAT